VLSTGEGWPRHVILGSETKFVVVFENWSALARMLARQCNLQTRLARDMVAVQRGHYGKAYDVFC
jgi:hypothetical protein